MDATVQRRRSMLNTQQIIEVYNDLNRVLKRKPDGTVSYRDGESDATVAKRNGVTALNVANLRKTTFGMLHNRTHDDQPTLERVAQTIAELSKRLESLEDAFTRGRLI
jgi:hypothetical protein